MLLLLHNRHYNVTFQYTYNCTYIFTTTTTTTTTTTAIISCCNKVDNYNCCASTTSIKQTVLVFETDMDSASVALEDRWRIPELWLEDNSYTHLVQQLKEFEVEHGRLDVGIFNTRQPVTKPYTFYELPTYELLSCIWNICKHFAVTQLQEVAAGCGLLSYVANHYSNETGVTFQPSDNNSWFGGRCYGKVEVKSFADISCSDPVLISWLHETCQAEFVAMLKRNQPRFIIHVGEGPGGSCYDEHFLSTMAELGYCHQLIPAKTLSKADYFQHDTIRRNKGYTYSRSCITLLFKARDTTDFRLVCGQDNLHRYEPCDNDYALQDIRVLEPSLLSTISSADSNDTWSSLLSVLTDLSELLDSRRTQPAMGASQISTVLDSRPYSSRDSRLPSLMVSDFMKSSLSQHPSKDSTEVKRGSKFDVVASSVIRDGDDHQGISPDNSSALGVSRSQSWSQGQTRARLQELTATGQPRTVLYSDSDTIIVTLDKKFIADTLASHLLIMDEVHPWSKMHFIQPSFSKLGVEQALGRSVRATRHTERFRILTATDIDNGPFSTYSLLSPTIMMCRRLENIPCDNNDNNDDADE